MKEERMDPASVLDKLIGLCGQATLETPPSKSGRKSSDATKKPGRLDMIRQALDTAWKRHGLDEEPQIVEKVAEAISCGKGVTLVGSIGSGKTKRLEAICQAIGSKVFGAGELMRMVRE